MKWFSALFVANSLLRNGFAEYGFPKAGNHFAAPVLHVRRAKSKWNYSFRLQKWLLRFAAADLQKFMFDTLSESYYQGNEIVKYAVDSLISFAKNDDGRGGHQDFLHDDQSVAIKHTLLMVNASDKSVWQKVAAWLLSLAKRFGNLTMTQLQRASRQLDDVVNGKYDWRISKFMEQHGLSR